MSQVIIVFAKGHKLLTFEDKLCHLYKQIIFKDLRPLNVTSIMKEIFGIIIWIREYLIPVFLHYSIGKWYRFDW